MEDDGLKRMRLEEGKLVRTLHYLEVRGDEDLSSSNRMGKRLC